MGVPGRNILPYLISGWGDYLTLSSFIYPVLCHFHFQSFFGFGQSADIDIQLDGAETRKMAEMKTEDGKKERYYLYYDGESVSGKVGNVFLSGTMEGITCPSKQ